MTAQELRQKYIHFFSQLGHQEVPNVSLVPEGDPSALFISAGMHPLVPYLLGEPHPLGKRLVNIQRCLRTDDLEKVGDAFHHTFFEMLGNWSLGDYFKKEMIPWSLRFLTKELNLKKNKLSVTIFAGDKDASYDQEAEVVWQKTGIPKSRIFPLPKKDNWWGPVGQVGPCGPDSEIFYDTGRKSCSSRCRPGCHCGKYFEIWNLVFMEYEKTRTGQYKPLAQKNVDTGMGVERTTAILEDKDDVYQTELFWPIIKEVEVMSGESYQGYEREMRIMADHLRAATFIMADGVEPSNVDRGYILRRLIRGAIFQGRVSLGIQKKLGRRLIKAVVFGYQGEYSHLKDQREAILSLFEEEEERLLKVVKKGIPKLERYLKTHQKSQLTGKDVFDFKQTYGLPPELFYEMAGFLEDKEHRQRLQGEFEKAFRGHQKVSRAGLERKFSGGLADHSLAAVKLHTATHLLHQALSDVLGEHVKQVGSNITAVRLRFDFTHSEKLSPEEIRRVEVIVNEKIKADLSVKMEMMSLKEAKKRGAMAFFDEKYGERVKVYSIGDYSTEVCAGPHVNSTREIGSVKIVKEESAGAGKRRLYAVIE